ncbi:MAG: glucose-1-phosphate adenylyltransferase, partial [Chlamydiae bacterium]|nr:glucose-1-phosphate adenylyltransferase [Chlamydiota bacterium]
MMSEPSLLSQKVATIVLAGGQGTRLHPLTEYRCKPAVCFAGRHRLIDVPISNSLNARIYQIFVISQHFASHLQQHLAASYPHNFLQQGHLEMLCPEETSHGINWFLGTADAVRKNIRYLEHLPVEYLLILSGDQLYHMDLLAMVDKAKETKADLVIASLLVQEKEAKRMGLLQINAEQQITDF